MASASTLALVPTEAVVYATTNVTNASNTTNETTTTSATNGATSINLSWKAGVLIGALVASPVIMGLGL
jgi:uncharacterized membrane protein YjjB (DUF3815 family)